MLSVTPASASRSFPRAPSARAGGVPVHPTKEITVTYEDVLFDALETVLDWDLSDEACTEAVTVQACMLAGIEPEDIPG